MLLGSHKNLHACQSFLKLIAAPKVVKLESEKCFNRGFWDDNTSQECLSNNILMKHTFHPLKIMKVLGHRRKLEATKEFFTIFWNIIFTSALNYDWVVFKIEKPWTVEKCCQSSAAAGKAKHKQFHAQTNNVPFKILLIDTI